MERSEPVTEISYSIEDYDFALPEDLIAQKPAERREGSRLMVLNRAERSCQHTVFSEVLSFLHPGDVLVLNRTRVIPARVFGTRNATGGKVEFLILAAEPEGIWRSLVKTRGRLRPGEALLLGNGEVALEVLESQDRGAWRLRETRGSLRAHLESNGKMPLPPYIKRDRTADPLADLDRERYQTVYGDQPGAVAAPTAGLHFSEALLSSAKKQGVRIARVLLHVGLGTFQPIQTEDIREHVMHEEFFEVSEEAAREVNAARSKGRRVIAVGTTSLRCLESAWSPSEKRVVPSRGMTGIFIHPPLPVRSIDGLLTNFHLPKSSLLLLVSAFAGRQRVLDSYRRAIEERYRFFSYGDAMLIL